MRKFRKTSLIFTKFFGTKSPSFRSSGTPLKSLFTISENVSDFGKNCQRLFPHLREFDINDVLISLSRITDNPGSKKVQKYLEEVDFH